MVSLIKTEPLTDNSVYGVRQVQYTVGGESGKNFIDALVAASFRHSVVIESTTSAYSRVVGARQTKISELGEALSYIAKALGNVDKKTKTTDNLTISNAGYVRSVAEKYGVSLSWSGSSTMKLGDLQKSQTNVKYAIDREDNDIQQDIVTLQSFISKRDNAYSGASKVVRKANQAASSTIGNIGS